MVKLLQDYVTTLELLHEKAYVVVVTILYSF